MKASGVKKPICGRRNMMASATSTMPTAHPTMAIAMAAGTMEKAISTAATLAKASEMKVRKQRKIYAPPKKVPPGGGRGYLTYLKASKLQQLCV